mgnify:CR=1 FL=1
MYSFTAVQRLMREFSNSVDLGDMAVKTSEFVGNTSDVLINTLNETAFIQSVR